jgi:beta-barrel assembly-enhancing protease
VTVRRGGVLVLSLLAPLVAGCATPAGRPDVVADLAPTEQPSDRTDEASLWLHADRLEEQLKTSPIVVRDPALQRYVASVVCRIAGPHCPRIRVYVVRRRGFYAAMAPNGMMEVGTGLLLRTANEAQLACVIGHEIGHYLRRHTMQRWADFQARVANFRSESGSLAAFSRDQEREADEVGFDLMVRSGYDPRQAVRAWERVLATEPRPPANMAPIAALATHPPTAERVNALREYADKAATTDEPRVGREDHVARLRPVRGWILDDEVRGRQFASTEALVRLLIEDGDGLGELHFFDGEIHRLRSAQGDLTRAIEDYRRALEFPDAPAATQRSLGLVALRTGDRPAAREALARYLERAPQAEDRELIAAQLAELDGP